MVSNEKVGIILTEVPPIETSFSLFIISVVTKIFKSMQFSTIFGYKKFLNKSSNVELVNFSSNHSSCLSKKDDFRVLKIFDKLLNSSFDGIVSICSFVSFSILILYKQSLLCISGSPFGANRSNL